jgi:WD40 repeat protein
MFGAVIAESAPHLYLSALPFAPKKSLVSIQFSQLYLQSAYVFKGHVQDWPSVQNILNGHEGQINSVAFSSNGRRIVSGSRDDTVRVWDAETGEPVAGPFQGHESNVKSVAFSSDGQRIVSGLADNTVCVWNAETGEPVAMLALLHSHLMDRELFLAQVITQFVCGMLRQVNQ